MWSQEENAYHNSRLASISYLVYSSIDFNGDNEISITNGLERKGTVINTSERENKIGNFSKKKACLDQYFDNWGNSSGGCWHMPWVFEITQAGRYVSF